MKMHRRREIKNIANFKMLEKEYFCLLCLLQAVYGKSNVIVWVKDLTLTWA